MNVGLMSNVENYMVGGRIKYGMDSKRQLDHAKI